MDRTAERADSTRIGAVRRDEECRLHQRLLQRDRSAALECFDRFGPVVYCTVASELGDPVGAEAVTERLFVELWLRPHEVDPGRGPLVLQLIRRFLAAR